MLIYFSSRNTVIPGLYKNSRVTSFCCAFQNGTGMKLIRLDAGAVPYDLAVDSYGQQVYWTDTASNSIKVYSLKKKTNLGVVFRQKNVYPRSIVLHPEKG